MNRYFIFLISVLILGCGTSCAGDDAPAQPDKVQSDSYFSKASGTYRKELFLVPGATHIQTYFVPEYVAQITDKRTQFFDANLK